MPSLQYSGTVSGVCVWVSMRERESKWKRHTQKGVNRYARVPAVTLANRLQYLQKVGYSLIHVLCSSFTVDQFCSIKSVTCLSEPYRTIVSVS